MSKIGRKPIALGSVTIELKGQEVHFKGKKASGVHILPDVLQAHIDAKELKLTARKTTQGSNRVWGLHRALLANEIQGADQGFEKKLKIVGLGFKAAVAGSKLNLSLGYSHKLDIDLPVGVIVEIDKTGQLLTFKSSDKALLGHVCSQVRALREPEPYKGTGIQYFNEVIIRKAGKTSAK